MVPLQLYFSWKAAVYKMQVSPGDPQHPARHSDGMRLLAVKERGEPADHARYGASSRHSVTLVHSPSTSHFTYSSCA